MQVSADEYLPQPGLYKPALYEGLGGWNELPATIDARPGGLTGEGAGDDEDLTRIGFDYRIADGEAALRFLKSQVGAGLAAGS